MRRRILAAWRAQIHLPADKFPLIIEQSFSQTVV
jgi:hypothetical protein